MAKSPTHTDTDTDANAIPHAVMAALAATTYDSDIGPVKLVDLSPEGAVHFMAYGIMQSTRDASAAVKAKAQALALKAVLQPDTLSENDREELKELDAAFDDSVHTEAEEALLRTVARAFISAVAQQKGVKLSAKAVANGVETFLGPNGPKAPSYPALMKVFGLVKGVVMEAKRARLQACIDGTIGKERAPRGKAAEADGSLSDLGLFD